MRHARPGIALIDMVASLTLLAMVLAAASKLMLSNIRTLRTTNEVIAQSIDLDLLLGRMKRDVWSAREVHVGDKIVQLRLPDRFITWRVLDDGRMMRQVNKDREQVWPAAPGRLRFGEATAGITVDLGEEPAMLMVSQVMRGAPR